MRSFGDFIPFAGSSSTNGRRFLRNSLSIDFLGTSIPKEGGHIFLEILKKVTNLKNTQYILILEYIVLF